MANFKYLNVQPGDHKDITIDQAMRMITDALQYCEEWNRKIDHYDYEKLQSIVESHNKLLEDILNANNKEDTLSIFWSGHRQEGYLPEHLSELLFKDAPPIEKIKKAQIKPGIVDYSRRENESIHAHNAIAIERLSKRKEDAEEFFNKARQSREQGKNEEAEVYEARVRFIGSGCRDKTSDMLLLDA